MIHLPECWLSEGKFDAVCICDRLRACEQRARLDALQDAAAAAYKVWDSSRATWNDALNAFLAELNKLEMEQDA